MKHMKKAMVWTIILAMLLSNGGIGVVAETILRLPQALEVIEEEAFYGDNSIDKVELGDNVKEIRARAFANSTLSEINLPASIETIDTTAFDGPDKVTVTAQEGTRGYDWAVENGYIQTNYPESTHPYASDSDETWTYIHPKEAFALRVTFSSLTSFEDDYDELTITDSAGNSNVYTGTELAGMTIVVPGNSFTLRLTSDDSVETYGFAISRIKAYTEEEYAAYIEELNTHPFVTRELGNGTLEIAGYRGTNPVVTIPSEIDGITVSGIGVRAFMGNAILTDVTISEGIQTLGSEAFSGCTSLQTVSIPGTVEAINSEAFLGCSSLSTVTLGEGIHRIEWSAFDECGSLTGMALPTSLEYIAYNAFGYPESFEVIAEKNSYAYIWAVERGFIVPEGEFYVYPLAFDGKLTENEGVYHWDYISGKYGDLVFQMKHEGEVTITASDTWIDLHRNYDDEDVSGPLVFSEPGVTHVSIYISNNLTGSTREGSLVFTCGEESRTVVLRQLPYLCPQILKPDGLGPDAGYFDYTASTEPVFLPYGDITFVWNTIDGAVDYAVGLSVPNGYNDSDDIGAFSPVYKDSDDYAAFGLVNLEMTADGKLTATVPASYLTTTARLDHHVYMRVSDAYGHKYNTCYTFGVYDVGSPEWGYSYLYDPEDEGTITGVEITGYAGSSTTPVVPNEINGHPVTSIADCDNIFANKDILTAVTLPESLTYIGEESFAYCKNLRNIHIPDSVIGIGNFAFQGCEGLTSVNIPSGLSFIGASVFEECTGLTSIDIPDTVTDIGNSAFLGCTGLTSVTIPGSAKWIGYYAFQNCTGLESVIIQEGAVGIRYEAFGDCTGLTRVVLPSSLTSISDGAFNGCADLVIEAPEGSYAYNWAVNKGYTSP